MTKPLKAREQQCVTDEKRQQSSMQSYKLFRLLHHLLCHRTSNHTGGQLDIYVYRPILLFLHVLWTITSSSSFSFFKATWLLVYVWTVSACFIWAYISLCWSVLNEGCSSLGQSSADRSLSLSPTDVTSGLKRTTSNVERSSPGATPSLSSVNRRNENLDRIWICHKTATVLRTLHHCLPCTNTNRYRIQEKYPVQVKEKDGMVTTLKQKINPQSRNDTTMYIGYTVGSFAVTWCTVNFQYHSPLLLCVQTLLALYDDNTINDKWASTPHRRYVCLRRYCIHIFVHIHLYT